MYYIMRSMFAITTNNRNKMDNDTNSDILIKIIVNYG